MKLLHFFRGVSVLVFTPLLTGAVSVTAILFSMIGRRSADELQWLARLWGRTVSRACGVSVKVEGSERLDRTKPYIFAANHQSQFDIFALQGYLGIDFRWLAKKELFNIPVFGSAMRTAGYIPINRGRGREVLKSLTEAAERIAEGTSVIIFPEGTRSPDGRLQEFKPGAMVLAIKSGVPIVPVAITGTHHIMPKGTLLARPGDVMIRVGEPIETGGCKPKQKADLAVRVHDAVAELLVS
ncbi:MAG: 1-acyl-sn-glycerol-3-phosphate acyltransferase [Desulfobulbaceae bacterium]|nr:1-acyl-sn-glycerol-3-phosphate acyltransferase [Desulfobulbaceae bacterium]MCK5545015.1 1-acyl-sn-glycerol-3-phosphate acyltransferase [Desulfobulbaceae bacterium]